MSFFIVFILYYQFVDSFCTNIYDRFQSFALKDFLISGQGMSQSEAVAYMGYAMIPFYLITAMAPIGRILVDRWGIRRVIYVNALLLVMGCVLCGCAGNLWLYLLGTAVIVLSCSVDVQNIYLVMELPETQRASVKGIMGGVAAFATFVIPVARKLITGDGSMGWQMAYVMAIALVIIAMIVFMFYRPVGSDQAPTALQHVETTGKKRFDIARFKVTDRFIISCIILLVVVGIATPAVTFYNEPMLSFSGMSESDVSTTLMIQSVVLFVVKIVCGFLADRLGRMKMFICDIVLTCVAVVLYVLVNATLPNHAAVYAGICFGVMVGCYFSGKDLIELMMLERAESQRLGWISALSTYAYGIGDALGIGLATVIVGTVGMGNTKLLTGIPVLVASLIIAVQYSIKKSLTP